LLAALHPELARRWVAQPALDPAEPEQSWLPGELSRWLNWLSALPAQADFESVCASLAEQDARAAAELRVLAAGGLPAVLDAAAAAAEFSGALAQLRRRSLGEAIDAVVRQDLPPEEMRSRRAYLQSLKDALRHPT
jgi:hypothetical protein